MTEHADAPRMETGVRNLDAVLHGGLPKGSIIVISGPPGAGKTILAQQICFHNASGEQRVLYFSTLSEPAAKILRFLNHFAFFDREKLDDGGIHFADVGVLLRSEGLEKAAGLLMDQVRKVRPAIVVIDSFKVFDDLAKSKEELRKFSYELAINLMTWGTTTLLLGEYGSRDIETNPLFSIVDGLVLMGHREQSGEQQRFIQVLKMRGTDHSRDEHSFVISGHGVEIYAPRVTIQRQSAADQPDVPRLQTGIKNLDAMLGEGIPLGSSLLIGGVSGTGKTILLLEFLFRGAQAGEKGILFSFEETPDRLRSVARGLGWNLDEFIDRGLIAHPEIMVEAHLLMMQEHVQALHARRVAVDSVSVFLHKIRDPQIAREKVFQLASVIQNAQAVGFFATDIPYGANQISRFGVEETVVDGIILLSSTEEGFERQRYLEVYKLRNTSHARGRHNMDIGPGGVTVYPRYFAEGNVEEPPPALEPTLRMPSGVPGLDALLGGGLLERSVTLVSGSAGIGKSTLALQFVAEGARQQERCLFVTLEENPEELLGVAAALGIPLGEAVREGIVEFVYLSRRHVRANQLLTTLGEHLQGRQIRRVVIDSLSQISIGGLEPEEQRHMLEALVRRFKKDGATTLLTLEAASMYSTEPANDQGFSPIADNLVMLRYQIAAGELAPVLSVVKTRGSSHDRGIYQFAIGQGGARIGNRTHEGMRQDVCEDAP